MMKPSDIYLKAARQIDSDAISHKNGACWAIAMSDLASHARLHDCKYVRPFEDLFKPLPWSGGWWGNDWSELAYATDEGQAERKECRVLALLFMSHIAKDDE